MKLSSKNVRTYGFYLMNDINIKCYNYSPKKAERERELEQLEKLGLAVRHK